jgi:hypothetical protein
MADLKKLDNVVKELEEQSNELKEFNKIFSEIGRIKQDISKNIDLQKENNNNFRFLSGDIQKRLENSQNQFENLKVEFLGKIQELYQDNKSFQKELDASIVTRLDKHKSDIQLEIRNEGAQMQRSFENALISNFNSLEAKINEKFASQTKQLKTLKILLFIIIGIGIGLAIGLFFPM